MPSAVTQMPVTRRLALAPIAGGDSPSQMTAAEIHRLDGAPSRRLRLSPKYHPPSARPTSRLPFSRRRAVAKRGRERGEMNSRADRKGGLFAVVSSEKGGGRILSMGEMINAEFHARKEDGIRKMPASLQIGTYYHGFACRVAAHFEGRYCKRCLLDIFHARRQKRPRLLYDPTHHANANDVREGNNSQAVEQLWSTMGEVKRSELSRPRFRCLVRSYCIWKNKEASQRALQNPSPIARYPCKSRRKRSERGY